MLSRIVPYLPLLALLILPACWITDHSERNAEVSTEHLNFPVTGEGTVDPEDLPQITFHGLRHTSATIALDAGVATQVVSKRLGHATVSITLDIYAHYTQPADQRASDTLASSLDVCR